MSCATASDTLALTRFFSSLCAPSDSQAKAVIDSIEFRNFQTGWRLSEEGGPSQYFGFILGGIFKLERHTEAGRHYIIDFAAEGSVVCNYTAWLLKEPADLTIEALEPGRIALLSVQGYEALFQKVAIWNEFVRKMLEKEMIRLANRERHLLSFDAEQRYGYFVETRQELLGRLMAKDVAAYLGITPVSLSRLMAKRHRQMRTKRKEKRPPPSERGPGAWSS